MRSYLEVFRSIYDKSFYQTVIQTYPLSRGLTHLLRLASIATVLLAVYLVFQLNPQSNQFVDWLEKEMPEITLTPDRLIMNAKSPFTFDHPVYGEVAKIDTTQELATPEEIANYFVYVTSKRIYVNSSSSIRSIDITRNPADVAPEDYVERWDGDFIRETYQSLKPWAFLVMLIVFFIFFFVMKMAEVVIFSTVGLIINFKREQRLNYQAIYTVGCFAITLASLIQMRGFIFPVLSAIPVGFIGSFVITGVYFMYALKEEKINPQEQVV